MPAFPVHPSFGSHISMRMSESGASFTEVLGSDWDWRKFDLDLDMPKVDAELGPILNGAATGDLSQFKARGGKLIIFQGWADPIVAPAQTIALYKGLSDKFGGDQETQKFARLFMAPGAGHCGLGGGLNAMQRPLCPHPQKAWYKGGGDPNIAANYICAVDNK
jgi:feruloyl esterase